MITEMLKKEAKRMLLKYTAGRLMFCPYCDSILDMRTMTILDAEKDGKSVEIKAMCDSCFKKVKPVVPMIHAELKKAYGEDVTLEIIHS